MTPDKPRYIERMQTIDADQQNVLNAGITQKLCVRAGCVGT